MASSKSLDSPTCWRRGGLRYDPHDQRHRHAEVDESHRVAPASFLFRRSSWEWLDGPWSWLTGL